MGSLAADPREAVPDTLAGRILDGARRHVSAEAAAPPPCASLSAVGIPAYRYYGSSEHPLLKRATTP
jgi:hypothetical protein